MVARQNIVKAERAIREAFEEFVHGRSSDKVHVFVNQYGHVEVLLGCAAFEGMTITERQDTVWDHLRTHVDSDDLSQLSSVHAMGRDEYDANVKEI